jgi:hypothetical protein
MFDILQGYNGTIFAYGQTGSGKSYTMLGSLLEDENEGIIPRGVRQIFSSIESDDNEIEFTLKVSMLEIYKETLRDLLEIQSSALQIKECPRRGVYVKGLTEVCVMTQHEVIDLLCLGQQLRTVASTRLNNSSSRSHFLFFLEVTQRLTNDSEKKGILNLVDLAGSEKVNHSGVTGNNLEEAKKINLSLSALGKVINSLILNNDHIPYRDSKLTRILQESLGGNFKTTLLVTCSPSARSYNETMDTLKFAVRAKAIKNRAKINLKNPPENYIKMIEMLKNELLSAKTEIKTLRSKLVPDSKEKIQVKDSKHIRKASAGNLKPPQPVKNNLNEKLSVTSENDLGYLPTQEKNLEDHPCQLHEAEILRLSLKVSNLTDDLGSRKSKILELEERLVEAKKKQLALEQKSHEIYQSYSTSINLIHKDSTEIAILRSRAETLQNHVNKLSKLLEESEKRHKIALQDFKGFRENTIIEFKLETDSARGDIPVMTLNNGEETRNLSFSSLFVSCDPTTVASPYSDQLRKALEDPSFMSKDFVIYILKQQILQAAVNNNELTSSISSLHWKISLLKHKYCIKRDLCQNQQEHIRKLEEIIDHLHNSYTRIVSITEKIELGALNAQHSLLRNKTLRSVTNKCAFTSRSALKRPTETSRNIACQIQSRVEESSLFLRIKELESNLDLQKQFNIQLKRNNDIFKSQAQKYLQMLDEYEKTSIQAERNERLRWKKMAEALLENSERELSRKQEEIIKLNSVLAGWVNSFMSMQESMGTKIISQSQYSEVISLLEKTNSALSEVNINPARIDPGFSFLQGKSSSNFFSGLKGDFCENDGI